jgi:hypothetical protein
MSAKYQDMKLGKILAIAGCRMIPNGKGIDVTASDGVVVLRGGIQEIREQLAFNCHYYGEPIVHPSAKPFKDESSAVKTQRAAAAYRIDQAMDKELAIHKVALDSNDTDSEASDSQSDESSQPEFLQAIERASESEGGKQPVMLPENRVGALQEHCQPDGRMPQYRFLRNKGPPHNTMHVCIVSVGNVTARGKAKTKKAAKHEAAGNLLQKLVGEPEEAGTGQRVSQKEIMEWGEQPIDFGASAEMRRQKFAEERMRSEQREAMSCGLSGDAEARKRRKLELIRREREQTQKAAQRLAGKMQHQAARHGAGSGRL